MGHGGPATDLRGELSRGKCVVKQGNEALVKPGGRHANA